MSSESQVNNFDEIRQDCWNDSLHLFGASYIYSKRAQRIGKFLKANNFLGIVVPILIGGIVTSYNISPENLNTILFIAAPISILQLVLSALSLTYKWDDSYSYYLESVNDSSALSNDYKNLAKYPPLKINEFKAKKELIDVKNNIIGNSNGKYPLTDKEKRKAMRYSLRNFQRKCAVCLQVPTDMKSTDCGVCGKF